MWEYYRNRIQAYSQISIAEERILIEKAQNGSKECRDEIVLRHIRFLKFRIQKIAFPALRRRFGDDLLSEAILILCEKIETYDLNYRDKHGFLHPVKFVTYIWKRIDGFLIDSIKKENRYTTLIDNI